MEALRNGPQSSELHRLCCLKIVKSVRQVQVDQGQLGRRTFYIQAAIQGLKEAPLNGNHFHLAS